MMLDRSEPSGSTPGSSPGLELPADYYRRIFEVELTHWWHRGMREISGALLADRLGCGGQRVLDAGCGTGGFLRAGLDSGWFEDATGVDISPAAIALARRRVPGAELRVAPLRDLPFDALAFDIVVANDVIQHVHEEELEASLEELRRVLRRDGTLLVRTNGGRTARRDRPDWRVYDRPGLRAALEQAGFRCERVTHANLVGSLVAAARRQSPSAPTASGHGIPASNGSALGALKYTLLRVEARHLRHRSRTLPYGHTLFAVASPA
jgi:SAM-dependent methyltransferase